MSSGPIRLDPVPVSSGPSHRNPGTQTGFRQSLHKTVSVKYQPTSDFV